MKHTLTAVIYDRKGKVLSVGKNSYTKTHTMMARHANKVGLPEKLFNMPNAMPSLGVGT